MQPDAKLIAAAILAGARIQANPTNDSGKIRAIFKDSIRILHDGLLEFGHEERQRQQT